jgi:hypothetical protein
VTKRPPGEDAKPRGRPKTLRTRPPNLKLQSRDAQMATCNILAQQGHSIRDIAAATGLSREMARRRLASPERMPRPADAKKSPEPSPKIKQRRKIVQKLHKKDRRSTSSEIAMALAALCVEENRCEGPACAWREAPHSGACAEAVRKADGNPPGTVQGPAQEVSGRRRLLGNHRFQR